MSRCQHDRLLSVLKPERAIGSRYHAIRAQTLLSASMPPLALQLLPNNAQYGSCYSWCHPQQQRHSEYVLSHSVPYLEAKIISSTQRIDAVWDKYPKENNLKALTQQQRWNGPRTRVDDGSSPIPKRDWNSGFLKYKENKNEPVSFISTPISKADMC